MLGGAVIVLWLIGFVLLLFAWSRYSRVRAARRQERLEARRRQAAAEQRLFAGQLLLGLVADDVPAGERVWDVVLDPGERVPLNGSVGYARYFGAGPASHAQASTRHNGNAGIGMRLLDHAIDDTDNRARWPDRPGGWPHPCATT